MTTPVLTDRHGFPIYEGNIVEKMADNKQFEVTGWFSFGDSPVVWMLESDDGECVDASQAMLTDEQKDKNSWERATFCEACFNHYKGGVTLFKTKFDHPKGNAVYSACKHCLENIDPSTLPAHIYVA